ncbi:expansin-like EG45 domain-containing protein, partial [Haematococcus lacustris]
MQLGTPHGTGAGSFGILAFGACGYTNLPGACCIAQGTLPFARDAVAASADQNPDYPGSCGRCYEVRCKSGLLLNNERVPIRIVYPDLGGGNISTVGYFDGDTARPYLPSINPNVTDGEGRPFPGNMGEAQKVVDVRCYDENRSLRVRVADSCPCKQ